MLLRNNVGCRVFAELAYTTRNEMSYGNCKPNVLAKTVTVMTDVCRKVTVRPLVKCIRRMKRIGAQGQVPWFTLSCWRTCLCDSRKECHHLAYNESYIQSSRCLFRHSWFMHRRQGGFMVNPVTLIIIPEIWVQAVSGINCNYALDSWVRAWMEALLMMVNIMLNI